MKQNRVYFIIIGIVSLIIQSACNDPTVIGSELLAGDQLDIDFTDTLTIRAYNVAEDSIRTFNPQSLSVNSQIFPLGVYEDPIFGTTGSEVYIQPTQNFSLPSFNEPNAELDSVIMVLPYDARSSYGFLEEEFTFEVYQLKDPFPTDTLYSNMDYEVDRLIGTYAYLPMVNDSVEIFSPRLDADIVLPPQIRIPLNINNFDKDLFAIDSLGVDEFEELIKGICFRPTSVNKGMPSFNFRSGITGITVYYHEDTNFFEYLFPIFPDNVVTAKYTHDYSTSAIDIEGQYIGENAPTTDSLLFVQGMSGINFVIEVPYSENLSDKILNKAEIIFPIQELPEDDPLTYLPVDQIIVSEILDDGNLDLIDDVKFTINLGDEFSELFGGDQEADNTYRVNVTTHLQDMSRGLVTEQMMVTLFLKSGQASRGIFRGPGHSVDPAKLRLTFTNF
ncbi:MAG: DUF4270 family protein [Bacteroidota bacterium]